MAYVRLPWTIATSLLKTHTVVDVWDVDWHGVHLAVRCAETCSVHREMHTKADAHDRKRDCSDKNCWSDVSFHVRVSCEATLASKRDCHSLQSTDQKLKIVCTLSLWNCGDVLVDEDNGFRAFRKHRLRKEQAKRINDTLIMEYMIQRWSSASSLQNVDHNTRQPTASTSTQRGAQRAAARTWKVCAK